MRNLNILLNLTSAADNIGKNTFLVKENIGDKFRIIPWDLDGSWGLFWDGTRMDYTSILSNKLFNRLIETDYDNFKNKLKSRWDDLNKVLFTEENLKNIFTNNFTIINKSGIIDIENKKWGSNIDTTIEQKYLIEWTENRTIFLDNYFNNL